MLTSVSYVTYTFPKHRICFNFFWIFNFLFWRLQLTVTSANVRVTMHIPPPSFQLPAWMTDWQILSLMCVKFDSGNLLLSNSLVVTEVKMKVNWNENESELKWTEMKTEKNRENWGGPNKKWKFPKQISQFFFNYQFSFGVGNWLQQCQLSHFTGGGQGEGPACP